MRDQRPVTDRVLELLPADGSRMSRRALEDELRRLQIRGGQSALTTLCVEQRAAAETLCGHPFVRRVIPGVSPPVSRPSYAQRPLTRKAA